MKSFPAPFGYTAIGEQVGMAQRDGVGRPAGWGDAQCVNRATS